MSWCDNRFKKASMEELFHFIEEDVKEEFEILMVTIKMIGLNYTFEFQPLSNFILTIADNKDQIIHLDFKVHYQKKYLKEVSFSHSLMGKDGFFDNEPVIKSGDGFNLDFIKPIKAAFNSLSRIQNI